MKVTAYDVKKGDAFLLEHEDKKILVDGGHKLGNVLDDAIKKEKFIDLIICTHYDDDHFVGILGLLKEGYKFAELWLPDEMEIPKDYLLKSSMFSLLSKLHDEAVKPICKEMLEEKKNRNYQNGGECQKEISIPDQLKSAQKKLIEEQREFLRSPEVSDQIENVYPKDKEKFLEKIVSKAIRHVEKLPSDTPINVGKEYSVEERLWILKYIHDNLESMISEFIKNCPASDIKFVYYHFKMIYKKRMKFYLEKLVYFSIPFWIWGRRDKGIIRWFRYSGEYKKNKLHAKYKMRLLNAEETGLKIVDVPLTSYLAKLYIEDPSKYNHESLVALYENNDVPNVLFSGDSDFKWLEDSRNPYNRLKLKNNSVVTAAHHGSSTAKIIYDEEYVCDEHGGNDKLVFLRSDSKHIPGYKKRPCAEFMSMKQKYCRYCVDEKVILEYDSRFDKFISKHSTCSCI